MIHIWILIWIEILILHQLHILDFQMFAWEIKNDRKKKSNVVTQNLDLNLTFHTFGCQIICTDTVLYSLIHNAILFFNTSTMLGTTKVIG